MAQPSALPDYEKLGVFYLGHTLSADGPEDPSAQAFLYPSNHLLTHGVVIGMTGSGKTGLAISLLEEAALDGIPAIVIDPKGDLANLALTFPEGRPEDFAPWMPAGRTAEGEAAAFQEGLRATGQDLARVQRLRDAAEVTLFTPGSRAGTPVSILASLAAPPAELVEDGDSLGERVASVATSLLSLVGEDTDPVKSRAHILVSFLLAGAWTKGLDLDLPALVHGIQAPPAKRIGVLDLESFYPKAERFELAVAFNNLIASPSFAAWMEGPPLDVASLLFGAGGKPRISVFCISHLADAERMFFVTLLLGQMVRWMRAQAGTSSLRALLFMDEILGYFPPVANPPSKAPLLTLLKQARAVGLGVVLATQNPVDLDYKGLANAGTWIIGRLQTDRDKARVLEGLEGAAGSGFDKAPMERTLAALPPRTFVVHDVHAGAPLLVKSRYAMSYLRGPLTREELKRLAPAKTSLPPAAARPASVVATGASGASSARPVLPPDVVQVFVPATGSGPPAYAPHVLGMARVRIADAKTKVDVQRDVAFFAPLGEGPVPMTWDTCRWAKITSAQLLDAPAEGATFAPVPPAACVARSYVAWSKSFVAWLAANQGVGVHKVVGSSEVSLPNEDEAAFRGRLAHALREERDAVVAKIRARYTPKFDALGEKIRIAGQAVEREQQEANAANVDAMASVVTGFAQALLGRSPGRGAVRAGATAVRKVSRRAKQAGDVARSTETVATLQERWREMDEAFRAEVQAKVADLDASKVELERIMLRPKKSGIEVSLIALAFVDGREG